MRMLVAPLHYIADPNEGSEYTRSYGYLSYLESRTDLSGDVIVGYCADTVRGNFRIISLFDHKVEYISNFMRLKFIVKVFITAWQLQRRNTYDVIWHNAPFALNETFSLLALLNFKRTPFVVGPINSPHTFLGKDEARSMGKKLGGSASIFNKWLKHFDHATYFLAQSFRLLSDWTLRKSTLIFMSDSFGEALVHKKGIYQTKLSPRSFYMRKIQGTVQETKQGATESPYLRLLCVNYLVERKRTEDVLCALHKLVYEYEMDNVLLTLVGDGPQREHLEEFARSLHIDQFVRFIGYVPHTEIASYYADADIFVTGSVSESMPAMYFEAMASGLPLVIVRNNCTADLKTDGVGAYVVEPYCPSEMAEAIVALSLQPARCMEMGKKNLELVQTRYAFERTMTEFIGMIASSIEDESVYIPSLLSHGR